MARPESPIDPDGGPVAEFAAQLRKLRDSVGKPEYRLLSDHAYFAHVTLAEAARGRRLPTWDVTEAFVLGCTKYLQKASGRSSGSEGPSPRSEELQLGTWRTRWENAKTNSGGGPRGLNGHDSVDAPAPTHDPHGPALASRTPSCDFSGEQPGEQRPSRSPPTTAPMVAGTPVLIVDDHDLVAMSLALCLRSEGLQAQRNAARSRDGILTAAAALAPGVVLLDLDLGRDPDGALIDGTTLIEELCRNGWRVIVLSATTNRTRIGAALAAGALTAVPKSAPIPLLVSKVRAAMTGLPVMTADDRQGLIDAFLAGEAERREIAGKLDRLSQREREVLAELARGRRAQALADRYVVSLATIRSQIRSVLCKLEVGSQLEAVTLYLGGR